MRSYLFHLRNICLGLVAFVSLGSLGCGGSGSIRVGSTYQDAGCRQVCGHWVRCRSMPPPLPPPPPPPVCRRPCEHLPRCLAPPPVIYEPPPVAYRPLPPPRHYPDYPVFPDECARPCDPDPLPPLPPLPRTELPRPRWPEPKGKTPGFDLPIPRGRERPPPLWSADKHGTWLASPMDKEVDLQDVYGLSG